MNEPRTDRTMNEPRTDWYTPPTRQPTLTEKQLQYWLDCRSKLLKETAIVDKNITELKSQIEKEIRKPS